MGYNPAGIEVLPENLKKKNLPGYLRFARKFGKESFFPRVEGLPEN